MKNQKNLRLQVRLQADGLAPEVRLNQIFPPAMAMPLFPARKIPVFYQPAIEEFVVIKHIAPALAA
jgi:hypothetical protein